MPPPYWEEQECHLSQAFWGGKEDVPVQAPCLYLEEPDVGPEFLLFDLSRHQLPAVTMEFMGHPQHVSLLGPLKVKSLFPLSLAAVYCSWKLQGSLRKFSSAIPVVPKFPSLRHNREQRLYQDTASFSAGSCSCQRATTTSEALILCALSALMSPWSD